MAGLFPQRSETRELLLSPQESLVAGAPAEQLDPRAGGAGERVAHGQPPQRRPAEHGRAEREAREGAAADVADFIYLLLAEGPRERDMSLEVGSALYLNRAIYRGVHFAAGEIDVSLIPAGLRRTSTFMSHPEFNSHHSEHEMLRYMR